MPKPLKNKSELKKSSIGYAKMSNYSSITSGLFGNVKPDPRWMYYNVQRDSCPVLCDIDGKVINFKYLTKKKPAVGYYIYVIRELEPRRIYIHKEDLEQKEPNSFVCATGEPHTVHHNCLAQDRRIICGGSIEFFANNRSAEISNASGHYYPNSECLEYVIHLLQNLEYAPKITYIF